MTSCPSDERLTSLLDERLDGDELAAVERHLEACARCQQVLEELTYERFSATEWRASGEPESGGAASPLTGDRVSAEGGPALLDPAIQAEQDSRRKRLILESFPRQPSSFHVPPSEKAEVVDGPAESTAYPPQIDGYDIVGRLGRGGMGVVYRARQRGLDRLVALKMLRGGGHADPESLARFRIEVRAVARLRHPNVVQVFDVGESQGLPYVALELLEGGSLDTSNAGTPQSEAAAASMVATLARAIASAHEAGIVHRDLKPANVLFTRDGVPKITDFGLAKRLDEEDGQTQVGQVMGSPSFMAPEQARGDSGAIGPPADIYSLGAMLYEMVAGRPPFKGGSALETLHQVVHNEPVPPSRLRPGLSRDLETICLKCLSKEPSKRYATAHRLADDLDRFLAGAPIAARRIHAAERAWKWARREPAAATLAVLVGGGLVVAGLIGVLVVRANDQHAAWVASTQRVGSERIMKATAAIDESRWDLGRDALNRLLRDLGTDPAVRGLQLRAEGLLRQIQDGERNQQRLAASQASVRQFLARARQVQLSDAHWLLGANQAGGDPRPSREAAERALDRAEIGQIVRDLTGRPTAFRPAPAVPGIVQADQVPIDQARRELVLLWAEAIGQAGPGEDPRVQARRALAILDQGEDLCLPHKALLSARARLADRAGDHPATEKWQRLADAATAVDPLDHLVAGRAFQLAGDLSKASAEYEAALLLDPDQFRAQLALAICELQAGRPAAARHGLTACLQRQPGSIDLLVIRAVADGEAAGRLLNADRGAKDPTARAEADRLFHAAEVDFAAALRLKPNERERVILLVDRGIVRTRASRWADAEGDFAEAVWLAPDDLAARINLGQILHRLGRIDEAIVQLDRAIALDPTRSRLYRARALARLDHRGPADETATVQALADLDEAIRLGHANSPDLALDYAQRARLQHRAGRFPAALSDSEEALRINPDHLEANLVRIQTLLELKRSAEVIKACDEALARRPNDAELWELRGVARSNHDDFAGAVGDFTQALTLNPNRLSARIQRGWAYLVSDASKLALADFEVVVAQAPGNAEALGGRGFALALAGQHEAATADAEESLRNSGGDDPRILYNAARIYARAAESIANRPDGRRPFHANRLIDDYGDRSLALIRLAIDHLPEDRRRNFYRTVVQSDPALAGIRQRPQFARLAGQMGRPAP